MPCQDLFALQRVKQDFSLSRSRLQAGPKSYGTARLRHDVDWYLSDFPRYLASIQHFWLSGPRTGLDSKQGRECRRSVELRFRSQHGTEITVLTRIRGTLTASPRSSSLLAPVQARWLAWQSPAAYHSDDGQVGLVHAGSCGCGRFACREHDVRAPCGRAVGNETQVHRRAHNGLQDAKCEY